MMNTISMGVIAPVFPVLVKNLTGQGDAGAAQIMGVFGAVWALMQLTFAPIFGNLSDRFGRRPVLLVSMFGLAFDYLIMALAPNIAWLFVGRVISGITASSGSAAGAYVADISTPEDRARNFGRFQAAANAGILLGPALGGFVGALDPRAPFWVAAGLALPTASTASSSCQSRCRTSGARRSAGAAPTRSAPGRCWSAARASSAWR